MTATVLDTAVWRVRVPLSRPLAVAGAQITATLARVTGGPPVVTVSSVGGSITPILNDDGLAVALALTVPVAARGSWRTPRPIALAFDVKVTPAGASEPDWLGRASVRVLPGTDSSALAALLANPTPVLGEGQPVEPAVTDALALGPDPGVTLALMQLTAVVTEVAERQVRLMTGQTP